MTQLGTSCRRTSWEAAYAPDTKTRGQFREWARRRGVKPAAWRPNPALGQALALWDLCDMGEAVRGDKTAA